MANELALDLDGDRLYAFGMNTPNTIYTGPFINYDWRGQATSQLPEAQVDACIELTLDICRRHNIEPVFYYPSTTFDFPRCFQVATIVCNSNCRGDKTDLCLPEWVYEKIEAQDSACYRECKRAAATASVGRGRNDTLAQPTIPARD